MKDTINLRIKGKGCYLTAMPDKGIYATTMRQDVRVLAMRWVPALGLKQESMGKNEVEFILQSTLDYIEQLEGVLEGLQANPDTPDDLLEEIERVLR
jgi:hypothetical protein